MKSDDPVLVQALEKYHRQKLVSNEQISELLLAEYGIKMRYAPVASMTCKLNAKLVAYSKSTVKRRRRELGLHGSRVTSKTMPIIQAEELVIDELNRDPSQHAGVGTIQSKVAFNTGQHLAK